jgi:hypothetical protein
MGILQPGFAGRDRDREKPARNLDSGICSIGPFGGANEPRQDVSAGLIPVDTLIPSNRLLVRGRESDDPTAPVETASLPDPQPVTRIAAGVT